jgi:hypothetical protein
MLNTKGFNITYARCLPHCINLVIVAFMDAIDKKFRISTNLKSFRGFLLAGGGSAKKLLAVEYGFTVSGIDFSDTRWASLIKAICYAASKQTVKNLADARLRLTELAEGGDKTAKDALEEPDNARTVFNVLYDFVESVSEDDLEKRKGSREEDLSATKAKLLKYFASPLNFAAFQLVDILFGGDAREGTEKVTTIVSLTQGNANWGPHLRSSVTGTVSTACVTQTRVVTLSPTPPTPTATSRRCPSARLPSATWSCR